MIGNSWDEKLSVIWNSSGFKNFYNMIMKLYDEKTIYPLKENIFNAIKYFNRCCIDTFSKYNMKKSSKE